MLSSYSTTCFILHYVNFVLISLKSVLTGRSGLVQPSLHKIDAAALKRDLKKFEENYPERVSQVWAQWLHDLDKLHELPTECVWPLEVLEKCQKIRPSNKDVAVPSTLQAMRCLLYTSPSPRDLSTSRMPSSA